MTHVSSHLRNQCCCFFTQSENETYKYINIQWCNEIWYSDKSLFQLVLLTLSLLLLPSSSRHLSRLRRLAFIKKLATVVTSSPSCCAIVACISFEGLFVSLKIACRVRLWISVKTKRGFLGVLLSCIGSSCSFRLQAENRKNKTLPNEGRHQLLSTNSQSIQWNIICS